MDLRRINSSRMRKWGNVTVTFAKLTGDESYDSLFTVSDNFFVREDKDEESKRKLFDFQFFDPLELNEALVKDADMLLFNSARFEISSRELKLQEPSHWRIITVPIGAI